MEGMIMIIMSKLTRKEKLVLYNKLSKLDRWKIMSPDIQLLITIYLFDKMNFCDMRDITKFDRKEIKEILQRLLDLGSIDGEWKKLEKAKVWDIYYHVGYNSTRFVDKLLSELLEEIDY